MQRQRQHVLFNLFILGLFLFGCTQLGLAPAKTFDERLAYAFGIHTAVQQSAKISLDAKSITSTDAEQVLKLADQSRGLLDGARAASKLGDIKTAEGKLALGQSILTQIQTYLRGRQ